MTWGRMAAVLLLSIIIVAGAAYLGRKAPAAVQHYGVSFASRQAEEFGLDPRVTYARLLDDLGVKRIRLAAYWDVVEPEPGQYDFSELDWQLDQAAVHDASVVLAVGRKLPRWPECFHPAWTNNLSQAEYEERFLAMLRAVVTRFQNHPSLAMWQLENEPFVGWFGDCPRPNPALLQKELALIRGLSRQPVVVTDSGELSLWGQAARFADRFGTTMYRVTWNKYWGYGFYPLPAAAYRFKARLRGLDPKDVLVMELQAEPWPPGTLIGETPLAEQFKSMDLQRLKENLALAKASGFGDVYLWGAEWWYWLKETQGHPEFWEAAKKLFQ